METRKTTKRPPFSDIREELRYWPYTIHQIDDTLNSGLIEGRAKQILFQALNARSITAFIGSGVSAAYGRMSWSEWKTEQLKYVRKTSKKFIKVAKGASTYINELNASIDKEIAQDETDKAHWDPANPHIRRNIDQHARLTQRWLRNRQQHIERAGWDVSNLTKTFDAACSDSGTFPGGEDLPVLFEIAQKLHDLLVSQRNLFFGVDCDEIDVDLKADKDYKEIARVLGIDELEYKHLFGCRVDKSDGAPVASLKSFLETKLFNEHFKSNATQEFTKILQEFNELTGRSKADYDFDELAKYLLVDECPHAISLLEAGLIMQPENGRTQNENDEKQIAKLRKALDISSYHNTQRDIAGIRENPNRFKVLSPFKFKIFQSFLEETLEYDHAVSALHGLDMRLPRSWHAFLTTVQAELPKYQQHQSLAASNVERTYLTPSSRFLVQVILLLLEKPTEYLHPDTLALPTPDDYRGRRSIIAPVFDTLDTIYEALGIRRFLTTNYDFEIERLFQDKGYRRFDPHKSVEPSAKDPSEDPLSFRTDGLGNIMRDMTFTSKTATDLLTFAAGRSGADVSVFHLHGRATKDDTIVATERDYMDLYLRDNPDRNGIDESILMAFSATPILFLGLGMNEADVLRPLRQFMSDQDRSIGYKSIVLLPAEKDFDSRAKMASGLYLRYGAHTIFYGGGEVECDETKPRKPSNDPSQTRATEPTGESDQTRQTQRRSIDWLHRILLLIGALKTAAQERRNQLNSAKHNESDDDKKALTSLNALDQKIGDLSPDLLTMEEDEVKISALKLLLKKPQTMSWSEIENQGLDTLDIQNCYFTSFRHQSNLSSTAHRLTEVDGKTYTKFYCALLSELLRMSLKDLACSDTNELRRSLAAMIAALDGLFGALLTATLNAALSGLKEEWRSWWQDWQARPPEREPKFEAILTGRLPKYRIFRRHQRQLGILSIDEVYPEYKRRQQVFLPRRLVRHRLETVITDLQRCQELTAPPIEAHPARPFPFERRYETGVRVFDKFVADLARYHQSNRPNIVNRQGQDRERVMVTVAANRGQGKGVFFSTLATRLGFSSYFQSIHGEDRYRSDDHIRPIFTSCMMINLSFSTEIGSVFDMMLHEMLVAVAQLHVALNSRETLTFNDPNRGPEAQLRAFQAFVLTQHHADGYRQTASKNRRSKETVDPVDAYIKDALSSEVQSLPRTGAFLFLTKRYAALSQEFRTSTRFKFHRQPRFLICFNALELLFSAPGRPKNREIADYLNFFTSRQAETLPFDLVVIGALEQMGPLGQSNEALRHITWTGNGIATHDRNEIIQRAELEQVECLYHDQQLPSKHVNYVHFARDIEPKQFLVDNFPTLALALLLARKERLRKKAEDHGTLNAAQAAVLAYDRQHRDDFNELISRIYANLNHTRDELWFENSPPEVTPRYHRTKKTFHRAIAWAFQNRFKARDEQTGMLKEPEELQNWGAYTKNLFSRFKPKPNSPDDHDWLELQTLLAGNRFCLTILLAAAEHLLAASSCFIEAGERANTFLQNVVASLHNNSAGRREEVILQAVMSVYRKTSIIGDPDHDNELHVLLLRNVAVIGAPVNPNILVRLPDVRDYFNKVAFKLPLSRRRLVARALAAVSERGLTFRLAPHPKLVRLNEMSNNQDDRVWRNYQAEFDQWPAKREYRYALHRQIQNYCFQRLGHLTAVPVASNAFSPTLYAAMPSKVVRLSPEGYLFLRRLLLGLSQYPDIRHEDTARDMPIFNTDDDFTRVQALRAALSLARTCFSIAAVSRFDSQISGLNFVRKRGHFETYRVRLRWILRKAWKVNEPHHEERRAPQGPDPEYILENASPHARSFNTDRLNALYLDEVVWLYNEVAVTSLVQGALVEAVGYIRQAIYLNQSIEGRLEGGRLHNMISLNYAIIQMERGRIESAQRRLNNICKSEGRRTTKVALLARGYLAQISKLQGRRKEALAEFAEVIEKLTVGNEDRSLAIMLNHFGRLLAPDEPDKAIKQLERAKDYSEKGGHEDVRHRILVNEVWVSQNHLKKLDQMAADRVKLREAQRYAETMGIYSLQVDTLHAQGVMLLAAGDHSSSGRLMTKGMAIARRNDMTLRLNTLMTDYAEVLMARRRVASAKRLLMSAISMAKHSNHSAEITRIRDKMDNANRLTVEDE